MRRLITALLAALGLLGLGILPAQAQEEVTTTIVSTPDNDCPAWARDDLTRTTTITEDPDGNVTVTFVDEGTFEAAPTEGDPDGFSGTVTGSVEFLPVQGTLVDPLPDGDTLDLSGFDCKADVPDEHSVGQWPLRYVDTEVVPVINSWSWTYTPECGSPSSFTEDATSDAVGAATFTETECPPESTQTPTPTPTVTVPPQVIEEEPDPSPTADDKLPATGTRAWVAGGLGLMLLAVGLALMLRAHRQSD
jgi:LPXTG-motif cell wall-anchored protein